MISGANEVGLTAHRMDDDLDTPAVSAQIFGLVSRINRLLDDGDVDSAAPQAGALLQILGAVGLTLNTETVEVPEAVTSLASQRDEARANKDWALADQLRDEITAAVWSVEDSPDGPVLRPI